MTLNLYPCRVSWVPGFVAGFRMRDEGIDRWAVAGEMPTPWEAVFLAIERGMANGHTDYADEGSPTP